MKKVDEFVENIIKISIDSIPRELLYDIL